MGKLKDSGPVASVAFPMVFDLITGKLKERKYSLLLKSEYYHEYILIKIKTHC